MRRPLALLVTAVTLMALLSTPAHAADRFSPISGSGSTWAQNALENWRKDAAGAVTVNFAGSGSSAGRRDFIDQTVDFAVSEVPFADAPEDGSQPERPTVPYAYLPLAAGGISLAYNLTVGGMRVTDLRLPGEVVAGIFAGVITRWNDPAIQAANPALVMPDLAITPVYRSDGSGTSAQFTHWMSDRFPRIWTQGTRSQFPSPNKTFTGQAGSLGVAGYVSQASSGGSIAYVENSYAIGAGLPVAKVSNAAGFFVAPTPDAVAVALSSASSSAASGPDLSGAFASVDPRAYPIPGIASMIVPTQPTKIFSAEKGAALASFATYAVCAGQKKAAELGYAPLPLNLVQAASAVVSAIPGSAGPIDVTGCANPTFDAGDTVGDTALLGSAAHPAASDRIPGLVLASDLTEALRSLEITVVDGGRRARVAAAKADANKTLRVGTFAPDRSLSRITLDATGSGTVDLTEAAWQPGSSAKLYLAESDGTVVAWNTLTIPAADDPAAQNLDVKVTASDLFTLTMPATQSAVDFGDLPRDITSVGRPLGPFVVVDDRVAMTGWTLTLSVTDFAGIDDPSHVIPASALGYAPRAVEPMAGVTPGRAQAPGSAVYPAVLASGAANTSTAAAGTTLDAVFSLRAPRETPIGAYRSTVTLTLIGQ